MSDAIFARNQGLARNQDLARGPAWNRNCRAGPLLLHFSCIATAAALAAATLFFLVMFSLFPAIDLAVSRVFFAAAPCRPDQPDALMCGAFPARSDTALLYLRQTLQVLPFLMAACLGLRLLVRVIKGHSLFCPRAMAGSCAFWAYIVAVGLLVNIILKDHWGRPRPIETTSFGGEFPFASAGEIASYCASNCSFVSGESAAAFWLLCMVPQLPVSWRPIGFAAAIAIATLTAMLRVAFGAHFLSDVVLAGLVTLLTFSLLAMAANRISEQGLNLSLWQAVQGDAAVAATRDAWERFKRWPARN